MGDAAMEELGPGRPTEMRGGAGEGFRRAALVAAGASLLISGAHHIQGTADWDGFEGARAATLTVLTPLALYLFLRGLGLGIVAFDRHRRSQGREWWSFAAAGGMFAAWGVCILAIGLLQGRSADELFTTLGAAPFTLIAAIASIALYRHVPGNADRLQNYGIPILRTLATFIAVMAVVGGIGVGVVVAGKGDPGWGLLYALAGAGLALFAFAVVRALLWVVEGFRGPGS